MRFGFRFRALIIKTVLFIVMALAAGFSIVFLNHILIPVVFIALVVLVILVNRSVNRRMNRYLGREIARVSNDYVIYERGVYIRSLDALYLWSDVVRVTNDTLSNNVVLTFSDGSELTLPRDLVPNFIVNAHQHH